MYVFPGMLKMTKVKQPTPAHQKVAETVLLCNSRYHTMTTLTEGATIISKIPKNEIKKVTLIDLYKKGIMLP
jgi:hypothetical protein